MGRGERRLQQTRSTAVALQCASQGGPGHVRVPQSFNVPLSGVVLSRFKNRPAGIAETDTRSICGARCRALTGCLICSKSVSGVLICWGSDMTG